MSKSKSNTQTISIKRFKNGGVYLKPSEKDMLARYDFGGLLQGLGSIAGIANPALGIGVNLLGGLMSKNQPQQQQQPIVQNQYIPQYQQSYQSTFSYGGISNKLKQYPERGSVKKMINTKPIAPADTSRIPIRYPDQSDLLMEHRDRLASAKNINDPELYKDLTPQQMSGMFTVLKENSKGKTNAYTQRLLNNYNRLNPRAGVYYESDTIKAPTTLKSVFEGSPRYKELQGIYEKEGQINSNVTGRAMGNGMFGVGNQKYSLGGALHQGTGSNINYITQYPNGGIQPNAELEQGEPFRTPDGNISQVSNNAPTHEQGGVPLNLPENTQILGKMVDPAFGKEFKELGEKLKRAQDKYKKILDEKPTAIAKKTAKMMLDKIQNQYDTLMQRQESMKQSQGFNSNGSQFPYGGMPLMQNGKVVQYPDGGDVLTRLDPRQGLAVDYNNPTPKLDMNIQQYPIAQEQTNKFNWDKVGDVANTLGSIAPIAYNLGQGLFGKAQQLNPSDYYNPNTNQVNSLMANRRYDVSPELESNRLATAQYYQGLRQGAPSQARYLAGLQTGQIANQRANQDVYARANNVNNQYKVEQSQTLQSLGQQEAATKLGVQDINTRAQAAKNAYLPTALSQLQQMSQTRQMMKGQAKRDKQRLALSKEMFKNYPFDLTKIFE